MTLDAGAESVASVIFALGDGIGMQLLSDPEWDSTAALELGAADACAACWRSDATSQKPSLTAI